MSEIGGEFRYPGVGRYPHPNPEITSMRPSSQRITREEREPPTSRLMEELATGFRYVRDFEPIRTVLMLLALVSIMGMPYAVLMPAFASKILHGGPNTLGILMGMSGVGALMGAIYLASRHSVLGLGSVIATSVTVFGIALIGFALSRTLWLSIALLPLVGAEFMVALASSNTVLQTIVEEHLRGRVMAFYAMAFLGTAPIGSLFAGVLAEHLGEPATVMIGGTACIAGGLWFRSRLGRLRELVRPIYVRRGVRPA
jgi:MFS family permease